MDKQNLQLMLLQRLWAQEDLPDLLRRKGSNPAKFIKMDHLKTRKKIKYLQLRWRLRFKKWETEVKIHQLQVLIFMIQRKLIWRVLNSLLNKKFIAVVNTKE